MNYLSTLWNEPNNFHQKINKWAKTKSTRVFYNRKEYATSVLLNFFKEQDKNQKNSVKLFIKHLHLPLFNDTHLVDTIFNFLSYDNNQLEILIEYRNLELENSDFELSFANLIIPYIKKAKKNLKLKILKDPILIREYLNHALNGGLHFIVSKNNMYRIELNELTLNAECCFNQKEKSKTLRELFDELYSNDRYSETVAYTSAIVQA